MKAIINGTRYDTEKAEKLGEHSAPVYQGDFHWYAEALYVTPRSRVYFLAGEGGALSSYGRSCLGGRGSGERIIPLTRREALDWASQYMTPEDVEAQFAADIQDA